MLTQQQILDAIPSVLTDVNLVGFGEKTAGKVRDIYTSGDHRILSTTDRVSAFDRVLGAIPYKGQVLNQLSGWWFEQTRDIVPNHLVALPDPNVTIGKEAQPLPVEVIVRGYITGVTSTSLWTLYQQGERQPYGLTLPDGLKKNDPLPQPMITPTTKATGGAHDERLTRDEIISGRLVNEALWKQVEEAAVAVFQRGQAVAKQAGLVLVDTKYEFGLIDGKLALIDEIHTPDSSRYWIADVYGEDGEPESFDKEFLRRWFVQQGYKGEGTPPIMPPEFVAQVALRYITAYEKLTGAVFEPGEQPYGERIARNLSTYQSHSLDGAKRQA
ncbi:MAG: phosphoribosylaminoimidazolesuccinocarboxamide synthase [Anaerolineae bacterium]|nr:phosphoribosylaminoimidazolesuccinocarboxamide synthase [Anaerolineae bacterium]